MLDEITTVNKKTNLIVFKNIVTFLTTSFWCYFRTCWNKHFRIPSERARMMKTFLMAAILNLYGLRFSRVHTGAKEKTIMVQKVANT